MPKFTFVIFSMFSVNKDLFCRDCCLIESSDSIRHAYRVSIPLEKVI